MTDTELAAIRERLLAGTRGRSWVAIIGGKERFRIPSLFDRHQRRFVGYAPDDIRALLAEVERLRVNAKERKAK